MALPSIKPAPPATAIAVSSNAPWEITKLKNVSPWPWLIKNPAIVPMVMPLLAPNVNSYRRLLPWSDAPINVHWGLDNRTVGLRVPANDMSQAVLRMLSGPIVLSSANRTGGPDAVTAQEVVDALDGDVALVLDDGPCRYGQPSSVVKITDNQFKIVVGESRRRLKDGAE